MTPNQIEEASALLKSRDLLQTALKYASSPYGRTVMTSSRSAHGSIGNKEQDILIDDAIAKEIYKELIGRKNTRLIELGVHIDEMKEDTEND